MWERRSLTAEGRSLTLQVLHSDSESTLKLSTMLTYLKKGHSFAVQPSQRKHHPDMLAQPLLQLATVLNRLPY